LGVIKKEKKKGFEVLGSGGRGE